MLVTFTVFVPAFSDVHVKVPFASNAAASSERIGFPSAELSVSIPSAFVSPS